ncbi:MAG: sugar phosphate isomerase/epimerase [Eubacteriales bacterium]|nr:sugar phosphate isomerase/epimerase [Eubacteriales bacterium]
MKLAINTSTLLPYQLCCAEQIRVSARAGFSGIELWTRDIQNHVNSGQPLGDLKTLLRDSNLDAFNGISFIKWAENDEGVRKAALETAKGELEMLAELGIPHIAAPLCGDITGMSLERVAELFADIYALGASFGVTAMLEIWGHSPVLNKVSKAAYVLMESNVEKPLMLCDVYHAYRGGDTLSKLDLIGAQMLGLVHINDYPASIPAPQIKDSDRVLPTQGDAPYGEIIQTLHNIGYEGYLSLEIFPAGYGAMSADEAMRHAYQCCQAILK